MLIILYQILNRNINYYIFYIHLIFIYYLVAEYVDDVDEIYETSKTIIIYLFFY